MKLIVNGNLREVNSAKLDGLLLELGYSGVVVATAVNGRFVPAPSRGARKMEAGDRVVVW